MTTLEFPRQQQSQASDHAASMQATPRVLGYELLAYIGIGVLALLTHFWALGERALHHDETLHAAYSWYIYTGQGYIHDPLLHGPFLYFITATGYFFFGDNDVTARLMAAVFGCVLTLLPAFLRPDIGRPAALLACTGLLISPVLLYVGRFIRHDIFSLVFELLIIIAIIRYAADRQAGWLYTAAVAFGLMVVNQETSYLFALIIGAPLLLLFCWRIYRPAVVVLGALAVVVAALIFVLPGEAQVDGTHNATRDPASNAIVTAVPGPVFGWHPLETEDNGYALRIRNRADDDGGRSLLQNLGLYLQDLGAFFTHPAVLIAITLCLLTLATLIWLIWLRRDADGSTPWSRALDRGEDVAEIAASLVADRRWIYALLIFLSIYTLFFTAFFTNMLGLITGTTGSLLYWLAQHNVERGGQPGHYYAVQLLVYEPLALLWAAVGVGMLLRSGLQFYRSERAENSESQDGEATETSASSAPAAVDTRFVLRRLSLFNPLLLLWWTIGAAAIYSWAGEKMPWLTSHIALPLILFAAWACGRAIFGPDERLPQPEGDEERVATPIFAGIFVTIVGLGFVLMTAYIGYGQATPIPIAIIPVFTLVLLGLLAAGAGMRWGFGWSLALLAICVTLVGGLYTARSAFRLALVSGDTPREMMVYTQTSPDVPRVIRQVELYSPRRSSNIDVPIIYDNETVWTWYMRDFPQATRSGEQLAAPPDESVQAVFMLQENLDRYPQNREYLQDFVVQRYPLRWWLPEDQVYRLNQGWRERPLEEASLVGQVLRAPFDYGVVSRVWNYLLFRELPAPLGSSDFVIAVRPQWANLISPGLGGSLTPVEP
jgi:predicted membrane-bound mannosyltransferase